MKFLLGFGIGIALGVLFAPAPGEQTRSRLVGKAQELSHFPQEKMREMAELGKEKMGEVGARVGRQAAEAAAQAVSDEMLGNQSGKTA
jgi:gas vesicle protein